MKNRILALLLAIFMLFGCMAWTAVAEDPTDLTPIAEESYKTLKKGGSGKAVRQMQAVLKQLDFYDGKIDGNFSKDFEQAVKDFQEFMDIKADGQIDYDLYMLLLDELTEIPAEEEKVPAVQKDPNEIVVVKGESYSDKEHVAAYLKTFKALPDNYVTKEFAESAGWVSSKGNLWKVLPGKSIGGSYFGNYEGVLPTVKGHKYYECDIDFDGGYRNEKRIVYLDDFSHVYYTEDHYETFKEL